MTQTLQNLNEQKYTLEAQTKEIDSAKEFLENSAPEASIFKSIGGLMISTTKESAQEDLKSNEDMIAARIKKLESSIERTQSKSEELKNEINTSLKNRMG